MSKLNYCKDLKELAEINEYAIIIKAGKVFLGLDLIENRYCIVYYIHSNKGYDISIDNIPKCYITLKSAEMEFNRIIRKQINEDI